MPLISVITINYNGSATLQRTCRSVVSQTFPMQWVVVDGGSTDGSLDIFARYLRPSDRCSSHRDRGIADAMNKGLAMAIGDAVVFMNAGDEFASPDSLKDLVRGWERTKHRWIIGAADVVSVGGETIFRRTLPGNLADPLSLVRHNCQIMHQAVLAERSLFTEFGGFDERWRIAMDYDLWVRWLSRGIVPQTSPVVVCRFHRGGASGNPLRNVCEERLVRAAHSISNNACVDAGLLGLAWFKKQIRGRYGRRLYRLKERLGVRW